MTRTRHRPFLWLGIFLCLVATLALVPSGARAGTGMMSVLVRANIPLTPDVINAIGGQGIRVSYAWPEIRSMAMTIAPSKLAELSAHPLVELVEPDLEAGVQGQSPAEETPFVSLTVPQMTSSTPIQTWNQDMANTDGPAETGEGVTVAVLDSGLPQNWQEFLPEGSVDLTHACGFGAEGWGDFHSELHAIHGAGGYIGLFPHGLAVSSVIVGFPSDFGPIAGAAPNATILPVRVLNQFNSGWYSWFTAGILYLANLKVSGAVPGPMVINFSIQGVGDSFILKSAIDYAIANGVLFVTIAGNFNPTFPVSFPGRLPESITAGASGWRSEGLPPQPWFFGDVPEADASQVYVASFSGREPLTVAPASQIDVLAPGSYVFGEWLFGPGFAEGRSLGFSALDNFIFGTSFAAPHVAGIVARMLEKNPGLSQADAEHYLRTTALAIPPSASSFTTPLGEFVRPWDDRATGTGLVRGAEAVSAAPAALLSPTPSPNPFTRIAAREEGSPTLRLVSQAGRVPLEFEIRGFPEGTRGVSVFDLQGRLVRHWETSRSRSRWDGLRNDGSPAGSGVYFVRAEGGAARSSIKVAVAR